MYGMGLLYRQVPSKTLLAFRTILNAHLLEARSGCRYRPVGSMQAIRVMGGAS